MPDHVLVPVIAAAMMPPIAMPIECPVLPHTCAANSVVIKRARRGVVRGVVAVLRMSGQCRSPIGLRKRPIPGNQQNHWPDAHGDRRIALDVKRTRGYTCSGFGSW